MFIIKIETQNIKEMVRIYFLNKAFTWTFYEDLFWTFIYNLICYNLYLFIQTIVGWQNCIKLIIITLVKVVHNIIAIKTKSNQNLFTFTVIIVLKKLPANKLKSIWC